MKHLFTILFTLFTLNIFAQAYDWAVTFGDVSNDQGNALAVDNIGNVYSTGRFIGTVDFDPSISTEIVTSNGGADIFIQKLDQFGNLLWVKSIGGTLYDSGNDIAVDPSGNVIITGYFKGLVDFDPGAGTYNLNSGGNNDAFILKLSSSGDFIWAISFEGSLDIEGESIEVYSDGSIYASGIFEGTSDFDPGVTVNNITSNGSDDFYISKIDELGNVIWIKTIGGPFNDKCRDISITSDGSTLLTGYFEGAVDFDPNAGVFNLSSIGSWDTFILKLDASGNFVWAKSLEGDSDDQGESIINDSDGNIFTVGYFEGTIDMNSDAGVESYTASTFADIFIQKLDSDGNFLWAKVLGNSSSNDFGESIDIDILNNIYISGSFANTIDFDPGTGTTFKTSNGNFDIYILKLDNDGNFEWVETFGGTNYDRLGQTKVDVSGNVFTTGLFSNTVDFNPQAGIDNQTTNGAYDLFVQKLTQCFSTSGTDVIEACDSYTWIDGVTYTASNITATHTLTNAAGCDSIVTLNLTILESTTGTDVIEACDTYTWIDGVTYTASNSTATHTLTNAAGCDSIVTLNLTILESTTGTDIVEACDTYTWIDGVTYTASNSTATHTLTNAAGCDSIVTLNLTILESTTGTDVVEACDTYTWIDGVTYTASNSTATHTLTNAAGCDSIVTLNLTILESTTGTDIVEACDSYTWIDGVTYTASNSTATHTLTNAAGCDSIVTLNLTILESTTGTDVIEACDTYTWIDGVTYTASNSTATHTLTNAAGCDSIVTLNLTILESTTGTDVIEACDTYTWIDGVTYTASNSTATHTLTNAAGCDSIVTLNLTILESTTGTDVIEACDSYTWIDGVTYTASNSTATHTLTNAAGCDSIVTLNLTINSVNTDVVTSGVSLSAVESAATYQWLDCDNSFSPIPGATNQDFNPSVNGNYALEINDGSCTDTSICYSIVGLSTDNFNPNILKLFPNPANDNLNIELLNANLSEIIITSHDGKIVVFYTVDECNNLQIDVSELSSGIYYITIISEKTRLVKTFIKQ